MQQSNQAIGTSPLPAGNELPQPFVGGTFVINLTASTTPVSLTQPTHPELRRFTFFVSRRREDGRERFRLHMGYFRTQQDAERLLDIVREVYPAAWAGIAPGLRLRTGKDAPAPVATAAVAKPVAALVATPAPVSVPRAAPQTPAAAAATPVAPKAAVARADKPAPAAATSAPARDDQAVVTSMSSVRAAIASLDGGAAAATAASKPVPPRVPELQAAAPTLSDSQVLRVLQSPPNAAIAANGNARSELTNFAVQLMWSVQPIDMAQVPQLAIFSAYALYGAEGNRDGRRWYGLRLGFFTDAVSARQVAQYVRSEFSSVSVVPVTIRERERATIAAAQAAPRPGPVTAPASNSGQFKLLDDKPGVTSATGTHKVMAAQPAGKPAGANGAAARTTGKRVRQPPSGEKMHGTARSRKKEMTLEETLEILGASQLQLDDGRGELINDSGVRHLRLEAPKHNGSSKLGRLISRLADRLNND